MDIPIPVTPKLLPSIRADLLQSCAAPEKSEKLQHRIVRLQFVRWLNRDVKHLKELVRVCYGLEYALLAQFSYKGYYCEDTHEFKRAPLSNDTVLRAAAGDVNVEYYAMVAIRKLYYAHDVYVATIPFHTVDALVSVPQADGQPIRICSTADRPDGQAYTPLLLERVVSVRSVPRSTLRGTPAEDVLDRIRFVETSEQAYVTLRAYIASKRDWMPKYVQNATRSNMQIAGDVAKQWLYWSVDVGAEHIRCDNYALLCLLYGPGCVELMPDHKCLDALMYVTIIHPETLASPETLQLLCHTLGRSFVRMATALEHGSLITSADKSPLTRAVQFARAVIHDATFCEEVAMQYVRQRERLVFKCSKPVTRALKVLHMQDKMLWNIWSLTYLTDDEERDQGHVGRKMQAAFLNMASGYKRAVSRSCAMPIEVADLLTLRGWMAAPHVETDSAEPRAGKTFLCSAAAQVDRYCLIELLHARFSPMLIQTMHYQLQLAGVQTCVREHGLPYVLVCPNMALTEQARHQWQHSRVMSADHLVTALCGKNANKVLLHGAGDEVPPSMLVLLHSEMYGIEQWLAILRCYIAALTKLTNECSSEVRKRALRNSKPALIAVTDVFMQRPVVVRHRPPYNSIYGTENVVLQLSFCEDLFVRETVLTETDIPSHKKRVPFMAAVLYYELTNTKTRYANVARVQIKLMRFVRAMVEQMWLDDEAVYAHLEMQLDGLNLPKIYMHTGFSNLTQRNDLRDKSFRENDYIHVCDTGELLSLRTNVMFSGNNMSQFKVSEIGSIALQADAVEKAYLCECQQAVFTTECSRYRFDAQSPWFLHDADTYEGAALQYSKVQPNLLEKAEQLEREESARVLVTKKAYCAYSSACIYPPPSACTARLLCSTHTGERMGGVMMMGPPAHEIHACTREMPISVTAYTGPSPNAVYVNVAHNTSVQRFLRACSISREHVQVVYSKQEREETDSEEKRGAMRMEQASDDYVHMLRDAKERGEEAWQYTVDSIVNMLMEHISLHVTLYPEDGLWAREMHRLCQQHMQMEAQCV